jgi:hypothetical protein
MLLALLLAAAAAATPAASPAPTPTAAPTPGADARPRTLADIARERKLVPPKGSGEAPESEGPLKVEELQDNGVVSDGMLSVYGKVRNRGTAAVCRVRLFFRTFDEHGVLLSKGETTTDLKIVGPGKAVPFGGRLKVPPGVRGSQERPPDVLSASGPRPSWPRIARVEAEVLDFSEDCR